MPVHVLNILTCFTVVSVLICIFDGFPTTSTNGTVSVIDFIVYKDKLF